MHRLWGILLLSMHEHAAAEDNYRNAVAAARQQSARFWELRAASTSGGSGAIKASVVKPAISSRRSQLVSPKGSTQWS
jgi:hypothetical protein